MQTMSGKGNSTGIAVGYLTRHERFIAGQLGAGPHIIYSNTADIALLPLLRDCVGVVCARGGLTSHLALVCTELGKPLVILNIELPASMYGGLVTLDSNSGSVKLIESSRF